MVRIRLRRVGSRNQASYRIVAAERSSPRDGRFLEALGHYNPRTEPATVVVDEGRLFHWLKNGAQPSEAVNKILKPLGTWERWERFKQGEDLDVLLKEAEESTVEVDPRTRRDDLVTKAKPKKRAKAPPEPAERAPVAPEEAEEAVPEEAEAAAEVTEEEPSEPEAAAEATEEEASEAEAAAEATEEEASEPEAAAEAAVEEPDESEAVAEAAEEEPSEPEAAESAEEVEEEQVSKEEE